jgi:enoyl-CoA hydratase
MPYETITFAVAERVATITVNRPDKLNALNQQTIGDLKTAIDEARYRDDVGAVLLTGAGRAFVAGADISELEALDEASAKALATHGQEVFRRFETSPKPTLAAVNGFALGGGCELAMACHLRIASEVAKFGQPEVKLGLVPGYGGTQRLSRLVGQGRALQMLLSGDMIDSHEAHRIGLVNRVVAGGDLLGASKHLLHVILANAPLAVARCIELVDRGLDLPLEEALALEAEAFGALAVTEDKREGTRAFLEKRPAAFRGA